jgi:hypothetical protein
MWLKNNEGERETEEVTRTTAENIVPVTSYSYYFFVYCKYSQRNGEKRHKIATRVKIFKLSSCIKNIAQK